MRRAAIAVFALTRCFATAADAGYETAVACAKRNGLNLPMVR